MVLGWGGGRGEKREEQVCVGTLQGKVKEKEYLYFFC
jgi:hypothetical protein